MWIKIIRLLLPSGQAWRLSPVTYLAKLVTGAIEYCATALAWIDDYWLDLFPATTRELSALERMNGISPPAGSSDANRRAILAAELQSKGGQGIDSLESSLGIAGFGLSVHGSDYEIGERYRILGRSLVSDGASSLSAFIWCYANGGRMAVSQSGSTLQAYSLSVPYDLTTASALVGNSITYAALGIASVGCVCISSDGSSLFLNEGSTSVLTRYDLPRGFDLASAVYAEEIAVGFALNSLSISTDGTKIIGGGSVVGLLRVAMASPLTLAGASLSNLLITGPDILTGASVSENGLHIFVSWQYTAASTYDLSSEWSIVSPALIETINPLDLDGTARWNSDGSVLWQPGQHIVAWSVAFVDPHLYLDDPEYGTVTCDNGASQMTCGDNEAFCNALLSQPVNYLQNGDLTQQAPLALPDDTAQHPFFAYVGGPSLGDIADVPWYRKTELDALLLRTFPNHYWIGKLVFYDGSDVLQNYDGTTKPEVKLWLNLDNPAATFSGSAYTGVPNGGSSGGTAISASGTGPTVTTVNGRNAGLTTVEGGLSWGTTSSLKFLHEPGTSGTVVLRVRVDNPATGGRLLATRNLASGGRGVLLRVEISKILLTIGDGTADTLDLTTGAASVTAGQHTVAITKSGLAYTVTLDGSPYLSGSASALTVGDSVTAAQIGGSLADTVMFAGALCEVIVSNVAYSDAELARVNDYLVSKWGT